MIILQGNKIERSFSGDVLFDNINIQVDERDRIALVGRNGAGKSTLLKILVGEEAPTSGEIDGADEAKRRDITGMTNGCGKMACKAFSKSLIVRAIYPAWPQGDSKLRGLRPCPS